MTRPTTEPDHPTVAGSSTDDDNHSNVVAFPLLPGKQALVAVLERLQPTRYQQAKPDPLGWLLQTAHLERYPDHILKQVAEDFVTRQKLMSCPTPTDLGRLCDFYVAMEQPPARGMQALLAKLGALPPRPSWLGRYRWATNLVLYWRDAGIHGYADAIFMKVAKDLAAAERAERQHYRPTPNELRSLCHHAARKGRRYDSSDDDDDDDNPDWDMMIDVALRYPELWSRWEYRFLRSVKYYRRLSENQIDVIEALYDRAIAERVK